MVIPIKIRQPKQPESSEVFRITPTELKQIASQHNTLIDIRGKVIAYALTVEERLDSLLSLLLMGQNKNARQQFKALILDKEFFTFQAKWQVLRDITKQGHISFEKDKIRRDFLEDLKQIIRQRNWFAHGHIVFEGKQPCLQYTQSGQTKSQPLNNEYFLELSQRINRTLAMLQHITNVFVTYQKK